MAISTSERTALRDELVSQGYSWEYIDEWQPKITLYRHRELKNPNGEIASEVGTKIEGLPGNPDYVTKKAKRGLLQWPPSASCECQWCQESFKAPKVEQKTTDGEEEKSSPSNMGPHYKG